MKKLKIISMGRVGTVAINRFLDEHPEIDVPVYNKITKSLLSTPKIKFSALPFTKKTESKVQGVLVHDGAFLLKKYKRSLSNVRDISVNKMIHLVRNPKEQIKSWINYVNAASLNEQSGWKYTGSNVQDFYKTYKHHFNTAMIGQQTEFFYKSLDKKENVHLIDFNDLLPENATETMKNTYRYLGVNETFVPKQINDIQNTLETSLLWEGFEFVYNNEIIHLGFCPIEYFEYVKEGNRKPWLTLDDPSEFFKYCPSLKVPRGKLIVEPKNINDFNRLSLKTRQMFFENINPIISDILCAWAKKAEGIALNVEKNKINTFSDNDNDFIHQLLKADLEKFYAIYPDFRNKWDI